MTVRIIQRDRSGLTVRWFNWTCEASTKKEARRLARAAYPLPRYTLGKVWR